MDFKKISWISKEKVKSFSVDVAKDMVLSLAADKITDLKDVVVSLTAEEIVKLLVPVLSTVFFGVPVPIPSKIVEILFAARRNV